MPSLTGLRRVKADTLEVADKATLKKTLSVSGNTAMANVIVSGSATLNGLFIKSGAGSPEGVVVANVASLYLRTDGGANTCFYVKETGSANTGWRPK